MPNGVRFHRVLQAPPERVYRAFLDADARVKWLPPSGFTAHMHESDPRVGGRYRMSFTNFTTGASHAFGGEYTELLPHQRIRYTDRFDDPDLPGEMTVTVDLKAVASGTELEIVQAGIPELIPLDGCYLALAQLAMLVEPEIRE